MFLFDDNLIFQQFLASNRFDLQKLKHVLGFRQQSICEVIRIYHDAHLLNRNEQYLDSFRRHLQFLK